MNCWKLLAIQGQDLELCIKPAFMLFPSVSMLLIFYAEECENRVRDGYLMEEVKIKKVNPKVLLKL